MSDEHHTEDVGAHEIDKMPNKRLFNLLFGLSGLTLLACIGVIQMFNVQVDQIEDARAAQGSFSHQMYRQEMDAAIAGYGRTEVREVDAKETERFYIPVAEAKKQVLANPKLLQGAPRYPGWDKTDTFAAITEAGGMPKPAAAVPAQPIVRPPAAPPPEGQPAKPTPGAKSPTEGAKAPAPPKAPVAPTPAKPAGNGSGKDTPKDNP